MKPIEKALRNLTFLFIGSFTLYMLMTTQFVTLRRLELTEREDNPRRVEIEKRVQRGSIFDRHGTLLAFSSSDTPRGYQRRTYLEPATYSLLGYASYQYGVNRIEARYDSLLMNETERQSLAQTSLLNLREGIHVQLTLDATWQSTLYELMQGHVGAGIVQSTRNGNVLAWLSLPSIDPNTLDQNWEALTATENDPFFDRVAEGNYQPGGMLRLPLMISALVEQVNLTTVYEGADQPIQVDTLELGCLASPPTSTLTLLESFYWGCPAPFITALSASYPQPLINELELLQLHERVQPFAPDYAPTPIPRRLVELSPQRLLHTLSGQGTLTTSPLHMNRLMSAIVQNGNAYDPAFLLATSADMETWQPFSSLQPSRAFLSGENAVFMRTQLSQSLQKGALQSLNWELGAEVGGMSGIGYSGNANYVWFSGYAVGTDSEPIALTLVIEDETDPLVVAQIARDFLASIHTSP
ncbi:MAG: penicillin-binding transpeptidase domain-containing protein [Phototrophicaceae bacterium]